MWYIIAYRIFIVKRVSIQFDYFQLFSCKVKILLDKSRFFDHREERGTRCDERYNVGALCTDSLMGR